MPDETRKALFIEDGTGDVNLVQKLLKEIRGSDFDLQFADDLTAGLKCLSEESLDVVLLNLGLQGSQGLETFSRVYAEAPHIPIIILSSLDDEKTAIEALNQGAQDYLIRSEITGNLLVRSMRYAIERKGLEKKLRESEEKYRLLSENVRDVIFIQDIDFNVTYFSPSAFRLFGYTPEEAQSLTLKDVMTPGSFREAYNLFRKYAAAVWTQDVDIPLMEYEYVRKDGSTFWGELKVSFLWENGRPVGSQGVLRDITERKQAEEAVRREKERAEEYLNIAGVMLATVDAEENITLINKKGCKILGYEEEELIGKNWFDLLVPQVMRDEVRGVFRKLMAGDIETAEYYENSLLTKDGEERLIAFHNTVIRDPDGEIAGVLISGNDVTEYRRAEAKLRESEQKYRTLIQDLNVGVFRRKPGLEGGLIEANPAYVQIYGYESEDELYKVPLLNLFEDADDAREYINSLMSNGAIKGKELRLRKKDGTTCWGRATATLIRDKAGNPAYYQGIVEDVTDWKETQDKLKASLEEKEILLREIHHRVKNNLQIVSSLLRRQGRQIQDETLKQMLKESENRVLSMSLIHEKLYHSENLAAINFREFVRSLSHSLIRSFGSANVILKPDIEDIQLPIDTAIPCGLIVNELVSNSLKHAFPEGQPGEIVIALHRTGDNEAELLVSDNGIGLPENIDIRDTESLGMDLVTILGEKQIGGQIELDTSHGTEFQIRFPLA
ncbi:MAG: PAS domain S-box protein [Chloroflexota bacterium]